MVASASLADLHEALGHLHDAADTRALSVIESECLGLIEARADGLFTGRTVSEVAIMKGFVQRAPKSSEGKSSAAALRRLRMEALRPAYVAGALKGRALAADAFTRQHVAK
jgi:hypothetical protein